MSNAKVTEFTFDSVDGKAFIVVERDPDDGTSPLSSRQKPDPKDLPEDLRESLRVWLAGNQS